MYGEIDQLRNYRIIVKPNIYNNYQTKYLQNCTKNPTTDQVSVPLTWPPPLKPRVPAVLAHVKSTASRCTCEPLPKHEHQDWKNKIIHTDCKKEAIQLKTIYT